MLSDHNPIEDVLLNDPIFRAEVRQAEKGRLDYLVETYETCLLERTATPPILRLAANNLRIVRAELVRREGA